MRPQARPFHSTTKANKNKNAHETHYLYVFIQKCTRCNSRVSRGRVSLTVTERPRIKTCIFPITQQRKIVYKCVSTSSLESRTLVVTRELASCARAWDTSARKYNFPSTSPPRAFDPISRGPLGTHARNAHHTRSRRAASACSSSSSSSGAI